MALFYLYHESKYTITSEDAANVLHVIVRREPEGHEVVFKSTDYPLSPAEMKAVAKKLYALSLTLESENDVSNPQRSLLADQGLPATAESPTDFNPC